jgi:hypothetical protein
LVKRTIARLVAERYVRDADGKPPGATIEGKR